MPNELAQELDKLKNPEKAKNATTKTAISSMTRIDMSQ